MDLGSFVLMGINRGGQLRDQLDVSVDIQLQRLLLNGVREAQWFWGQLPDHLAQISPLDSATDT